jgi:hypothetical protein
MAAINKVTVAAGGVATVGSITISSPILDVSGTFTCAGAGRSPAGGSAFRDGSVVNLGTAALRLRDSTIYGGATLTAKLDMNATDIFGGVSGVSATKPVTLTLDAETGHGGEDFASLNAELAVHCHLTTVAGAGIAMPIGATVLLGAHVFPPVGKVDSTDTGYGIAGATDEYNGTLNMGLYTAITGVVAAGDVRSGIPRYTGGPNGTLDITADNPVKARRQV